MRTLPLVIALGVALAFSGCLENMRDLKDRVTGAKQDLDRASADLNATLPGGDAGTSPSTSEPKPPVARIGVYGANGALLYQANFVAADATTPVLVDAGVNLTLVATESEALNGAAIASYQWTIAGKNATGPKASASWNESGRYPVKLTVTDSNGKTDDQSVTLLVPAKPFGVTTNMTSGALVGSQGEGQTAAVKFDVALAHAKKPATLQSVKVSALEIDTCDMDFTVKDKDGKPLGTADKNGLAAGEDLLLPGMPDGTYTIELVPGEACVAKDGVTLSVTETFLPLI